MRKLFNLNLKFLMLPSYNQMPRSITIQTSKRRIAFICTLKEWILYFMAIKLAINGFGRIGRNIVRALYESGLSDDIKIVAINELADPEAIAHLLKYDTSHGRFSFPVKLGEDTISVAGDTIALFCEENPIELPWQTLDVDVVLECTGVYHSREHAQLHITAGAKKVLFSHPADNDVDATIVYGINDDELKREHTIVSNGSCTTNCVVPVIKVLDDAFGIESGAITTIHASMNDQQVIDGYHHDLRRTRAASQSIIPVDTKLARGIDRILPKFKGRFEAIAVRVPTINVTAMDLSVTVNADVDLNTVNNALKAQAKDRLEGILSYTEEPIGIG